MKKTILIFTMLLFSLAHAADSKPLVYTGTIVTMVADPEITWDEKPHKYTAIKLAKPQNISGDSEIDQKLFLNVTQMQLVSNDNLAKKYNGKGQLKVTCSDVFTSHTGYHYTDLLCTVGSVKQLK